VSTVELIGAAAARSCWNRTDSWAWSMRLRPDEDFVSAVREQPEAVESGLNKVFW
jgi:hypothetical protein